MLMPKYLTIISVFLFFSFLSCQNRQSDKIHLSINNLPVDTCSIRINHIVTGKEIYSKKNVSLAKSLELPMLVDDIYILTISWPRTFIPHSVYKNKGFDKEEGDDFFELTKPFYFNKSNGKTYEINLLGDIQVENIEIDGVENLRFENKNCEECQLSDAYWQIYTSFFNRKNRITDSLKSNYYSFTNNNDAHNAKAAYYKLINHKKNFVKDELFDMEIIDKIGQNNTSPVSTFFLFYQLYMHKEFSKYRESFNSLEGDALNSKYYKMIKNQYNDL